MSWPKYDRTFGDARVCRCGHPYYRHFDTYDNMRPIGCKYCICMKFEEQLPIDRGVRQTELGLGA